MRKPPPRLTITRRLRRLEDYITMTAADLQAAVDALKASVTKIEAQIAELKNQPPPVLDQAQLDATVADVSAAATTLQNL